jgi:hypothetical protein
LDGVSKIHVSFLTQLPERKETAQGFRPMVGANGEFKTVTEFNGCDGRKTGWINNTVVTPQY